MGRRSKGTMPPKDIFASAKATDTFGMIFDSMLQCERFQELRNRTKWMYVLCRVQARSAEGKRALYKHGEAEGKTYPINAFVFPASHMERYGMLKQNGSKELKELEAAGFICVLENNSHRKMYKKMNVYQFSENWKH